MMHMMTKRMIECFKKT